MRRSTGPRSSKSTSQNNSKQRVNRPPNGGPIRTCIGCGRAFSVSKSKRTGLAFAAQSSEGALQVLRVCAQRSAQPPQVLADHDGREPGRGAWLCARASCIEAAWKRKAVERALKGARPGEELKQELLQASVE